jgi:hypothetical protein
MGNAVEKASESVGRDSGIVSEMMRKGICKKDSGGQDACVTEEVPFARMLGCRVRYFTDGVVIGSRAFVNKAFAKSRERFGAKHKDGARKLRGSGAPVAGAYKKSGFIARLALPGFFCPLAFPQHEQPQAMDCALEGFADETGDLPLHQPGRGSAICAGGG